MDSLAVQIATHGDWVPPGPESRSPRACASFFRWLLDKRRPEAEERDPGCPQALWRRTLGATKQ